MECLDVAVRVRLVVGGEVANKSWMGERSYSLNSIREVLPQERHNSTDWQVPVYHIYDYIYITTAVKSLAQTPPNRPRSYQINLNSSRHRHRRPSSPQMLRSYHCRTRPFCLASQRPQPSGRPKF